MSNFFLGLLVLIIFQFKAFSGQVRNLSMNDKKMRVINLSMGKSTILRFKDKPKKGVIGNSNYFGIEYIDNDVAIQPIGVFTTNLFIYTDFGRMYGLILKSGNSLSYDDLVNIQWKSKYRSLRKRKNIRRVKKVVKNLGQRLKIADLLEIKILTITSSENLGLYFMDLEIKNISKKEMDLENLKIELTRGKKPLKDQRFGLMLEKLRPNLKTKGRIIFRVKQKKSLSLEVKLVDKSARKIIYRKYL